MRAQKKDLRSADPMLRGKQLLATAGELVELGDFVKVDHVTEVHNDPYSVAAQSIFVMFKSSKALARAGCADLLFIDASHDTNMLNWGLYLAVMSVYDGTVRILALVLAPGSENRHGYDCLLKNLKLGLGDDVYARIR